MGIPKFFIWFRNTFGSNVIPLKKSETVSEKRIEIDNFLIDMNGLFHNAAQKVYCYGSHKPLTRLLGRAKPIQSNFKNDILVYEEICKMVDMLILLACPSKRVILCVDGPAPMAKQNHQRQRRFRSAQESTCDSYSRMEGFDGNSITPGTKFMDNLSKYIHRYIMTKVSEDPAYSHLEIIFSPSNVPSEGEHKALNYIRMYGTEKESYCIYGTDADLLMLGLATHLPKIYVLRDDVFDLGNEFFIVDLGNSRKELAEKLKWSSESFEYNNIFAINDFILLCFLVGNDFLPSIPGIDILDGGIDFMIEIYTKIGSRYGHLTKKDGLYRDKLGILLRVIGGHEKDLFETKFNQKETYCPDELIIKNYSVEYGINLQEYQRDYMSLHFHNQENWNIICEQYIEGIEWVLSYYLKGVPSWTWYYPHHHAPFASSLGKYLKSQEPNKETIFPFSNIEFTAFQQLITVLPPQSANLLPRPFEKYLSAQSLVESEFFPKKINIDYSGKRREWEGVVVLPMLPPNIVKKVYSDNIKLVNKKDLEREVIGTPCLYKRDNEFSIVYDGKTYKVATEPIEF